MTPFRPITLLRNTKEAGDLKELNLVAKNLGAKAGLDGLEAFASLEVSVLRNIFHAQEMQFMHGVIFVLTCCAQHRLIRSCTWRTMSLRRSRQACECLVPCESCI